jgi:proline iminopeptidase
MYYELHGSPTGKPLLVLHGGPGGGISYNYLGLFDLSKWNIIMYDQRGCGKSTPRALDSLDHNKTSDLVGDIEILRKHLGIDTWTIFGGSWGTTLGLVYAEAYPEKVAGLILRSTCLITKCGQDWLYSKGGVSELFPAEWDDFVKVVKGPLKYKNILRTYKKLLLSDNLAVKKDAVKRWCDWEDKISYLIPQGNNDSYKAQEEVAVLENHYFYHDAWLSPNQIINNAAALKNIPITLIHGRYDAICPVNDSFELKKVLPQISLFVVKDSGHVIVKKSTRRAIKKITSKFHAAKATPLPLPQAKIASPSPASASGGPASPAAGAAEKSDQRLTYSVL